MKRLLTTAVLLLTAIPAPLFAQQSPPSAEAYYVAALERMRHAPQPLKVRYHASIDVQGGNVALSRNPDGTLRAIISNAAPDGKPHEEASIAEIPAGMVYAATLANGDVATSRRPIFNATWYGIDQWVRYGMTGAPPAAPAATPEPSAAPHEIAIVTAFGLTNYRVRDAGAAACADGDPAHAVQLTSRDGLAHPLNYAAIDERTGLLCTLRFNVPFSSDPGVTVRANVEVHLATLDGYAIISDEIVDAAAHFLGIQAGHVTARVTFGDFAF